MAKTPGLWHAPRRVEVQVVKTSHRLQCCDCPAIPDGRRLVVTEGAGRRALVTVRCIECGKAWVRERKAEADRAIKLLHDGEWKIRL